MGETVTFTWPLHGQQLCEGLMGLLREKFETDFKLLVKAEKSGERQMVKVHHVILAIFCPLLRNVTEKKLNMGNYNIEDLKRLVEFIYTGKTNVNKAGLSSLRKGANAIGLKTLVQSIDWYTRRLKAAEGDQAKNHMSTVSNQTSGSAEDIQSKDRRPKQPQTVPVSPRKVTRGTVSPLKSRSARLKSVLKRSSPAKTRGTGVRMASLKSSRPPPTKITCKYCSYSADHNSKSITHMAVVHHIDIDGNKLERNVKCSHCSYTCYLRDQLRCHRYVKHSKVQHKCDQCPYVCGTMPDMNKHMKSAHSDERPLMCDQCGLRFKLSSSYTLHMRRHKGEKANRDVCGKTVALLSLKRHMELHTSDEKPNACHLCSFATRKRFNLRIHLRGVHQVHMDKQGNVLGKEETFVHSSAEENSEDCAVAVPRAVQSIINSL